MTSRSVNVTERRTSPTIAGSAGKGRPGTSKIVAPVAGSRTSQHFELAQSTPSGEARTVCAPAFSIARAQRTIGGRLTAPTGTKRLRPEVPSR